MYKKNIKDEREKNKLIMRETITTSFIYLLLVMLTVIWICS